MNVSFPHMGNLDIVLKELFNGFGCRVVAPPPITKQTLALGTRHSPETVCLPFKVTLGNFIEALDAGADTIITCGGVGPCRLGYYAEVQRSILEQLGYQYNMIVIEPDIVDVIRKLFQVTAGCGWAGVYRSFRLAGAKMTTLDAVEAEVHLVRPRAIDKQCVQRIWQQATAAVDRATTLQEIEQVGHDAVKTLRTLAVQDCPALLKVGLTGEFYVMLEPYVNQQLERTLGEMGIEVYKTMYLSDYVHTHLLRGRQHRQAYQALADLAAPYLGHYVGGHGLKSIGQTVALGNQDYDGMIHVYPFTCMPEVIAKNILPKVSREIDIPVLTLAYDEQSGQAGIITRLEAFVDLLKFRRRRLN